MTRIRKLHDDEVDIDAALVSRLVSTQFPRWSGLPVAVVAESGTDNVTFRLGMDLSVRLPRTHATSGQIDVDRVWLPRLGPHLPVAVPQPVAVGEPGEGYPFQWGVYPWLEGAPLDFDTLSDPVRVAVDLAEFVTSLQALDTTGAPVPSDDPLDRGTPLAPRDPLFREAVWQLRDQYDSGLLLDAWEASLAADDFVGPPVWIHGDLLPGNLLVHRQRLHAVIDFATVRAADPAGELLAAWYVFQGESRRAFRDALGADERMWVRARGWALSLEIMASAYYRTRNPDSGEPSSVVTDILADFAADS